MPKSQQFTVSLVVGGEELKELKDTLSGKVYCVCTAGTTYSIRMKADGEKHYGAIIQIDGSPEEKDFRKSPFTYFKNPYDDPGFWTEPSAGKYIPRVFSQPVTTEIDRNQGASANKLSSNVGRIRVYFFEVMYVPHKATTTGKRYDAPGPSAVPENKKWFMAGNTTRYGGTKSTGKKGGVFRIKDRAQWITYVELWYKDKPSLEILGWDGLSQAAELITPSERAKRKAKEDAERRAKLPRTVSDGGVVPDDEKEEKKPKIVIDLTQED
eukprot:m.18878 g.18878  ORF g.18878 m.18878 type:complete len:268 (-) comp6435_c0_seq1:35-838(-)